MQLSVIISERNDPLGTLITVRGLIQQCEGIDYEIIIIDNSDNKQELLDVLPSEYILDETIRIYHSPPCLFIARTIGVKEAKGRWLLFLDSHMLMGYRAIEEMLRIGESKDGSLGFIYGPCCYHNEQSAIEFVDRDIGTLLGVRRSLANLKVVKGEAPIAFRGVPMLCEKAHFMRIGGYGALAHYGLPWGGGDYLLGMKTLMLGYKNYLANKSVGIHLGPFVGVGSEGFCDSYMRVPPPTNWPRYIGMLTTAYICGGDKILEERAAQIRRRIGAKDPNIATKQVKDKAKQIGTVDHRWLLENKKFYYDEVVKRYAYNLRGGK